MKDLHDVQELEEKKDNNEIQKDKILEIDHKFSMAKNEKKQKKQNKEIQKENMNRAIDQEIDNEYPALKETIF